MPSKLNPIRIAEVETLCDLMVEQHAKVIPYLRQRADELLTHGTLDVSAAQDEARRLRCLADSLERLDTAREHQKAQKAGAR